MNYYAIEDPPSQISVIFTLLLVSLLAAFNIPLLELLRERIPIQNQTGWNASTDILIAGVFLLEALILCLITFRSSGFGFGTVKIWKRYGLLSGFLWALPPLFVFGFYPLVTNKPYHGWPLAWWLVGSIAVQLLFTGFVYGRMVAIFGKPGEGLKGIFSAAALATSFFFALFHWPDLRSNEHGMTSSYAQMQIALAFFSMLWMLNIRRWTGSMWPAVLNQVLVNFLAAIV